MSCLKKLLLRGSKTARQKKCGEAQHWAAATMWGGSKCSPHYLGLQQLVGWPARFAQQGVLLLALSLLVCLGRAEEPVWEAGNVAPILESLLKIFSSSSCVFIHIFFNSPGSHCIEMLETFEKQKSGVIYFDLVTGEDHWGPLPVHSPTQPSPRQTSTPGTHNRKRPVKYNDSHCRPGSHYWDVPHTASRCSARKRTSDNPVVTNWSCTSASAIQFDEDFKHETETQFIFWSFLL